MAENVIPANNVDVTATTIVTVGGGGSLEIFGVAADQVTPMPGRVSLEIQNRSGADIEINDTDGAAAGRVIADGDGWSFDLGIDYEGNLYIVVGAGGPIVVSQLAI